MRASDDRPDRPDGAGSGSARGASGTRSAGRARAGEAPPEQLVEIRLGLGRLERLFASRRVHSGMAAAAGVHLPQQAIHVLRTLGEADPQPVSDVARAARMDNGAVSRQLRVLEEQGLIKRQTSPAHGSIVLVEATAEGRRLNRRYERVRNGQLGRALAHWTPEEREQLGRLMVRLVDDLQGTPYLDPDRD
jgi:DNA-binding MarR family transcriptional regulator